MPRSWPAPGVAGSIRLSIGIEHIDDILPTGPGAERIQGLSARLDIAGEAPHIGIPPWSLAMTDSLIVPCAQCASLNRIPARVHDAPRGRCKSEALPDQPFELQQSQFANQIKGDLPLLVDVGRAGGPAAASPRPSPRPPASCRPLPPAKLDSEANAQLSTQLGIRPFPADPVPCREVARQSGAMPLPQLLAWLAQQGVR